MHLQERHGCCLELPLEAFIPQLGSSGDSDNERLTSPLNELVVVQRDDAGLCGMKQRFTNGQEERSSEQRQAHRAYAPGIISRTHLASRTSAALSPP